MNYLFPFEKHDGKPRIGLKGLDLADWIVIDDDWQKHVRMKRDIVRDHRDVVLHVLPGAEDGIFELREVLGAHLAQHYPDKFRWSAEVLTNPLGESFAKPPTAAAVLEQFSQWTQEDWAFMSARAPVRLEAGLICFPSRWSPVDKIGLESDGIHGPVPHFGTIAKPTQYFLERLAVDKPMWRLNWTIHDSDQLYCPHPHPPVKDLTAQDVLERTWLRIERQTLRRLPRSGSVVFSIRTFLRPMREVVADPADRVLARESIAFLTKDSAAYKGMREFHQILLDAL